MKLGDNKMGCPKCGYEPPKGRPKKLDDQSVRHLSKDGYSLATMATHFGVTRGAIQASLKRTKKKSPRRTVKESK